MIKTKKICLNHNHPDEQTKYKYQLHIIQCWSLSKLYINSTQFKQWKSDVIEKYIYLNPEFNEMTFVITICKEGNRRGMYSVLLSARPWCGYTGNQNYIDITTNASVEPIRKDRCIE